MPETPVPDPTFRYDPELAPGYWIAARSDFLRTPALSPTAKLLYLLLCSYAGQGETAWPGKERLAREMPCAVRTVDKYLDELAAAALVTTQQRGQGLTNLYYLHRLPVKADRQTLPIQKSKIRLPSPAQIAPESDSAESESAERIGPAIQAPDAFTVQRLGLGRSVKPGE